MRVDLEKMFSDTDYKISRIVFPVFNIRKGVDECNIGYVQGMIDEKIPFAAEVWRYKEEETLVVYFTNMGMIDRNAYMKVDVEKNMKSEEDEKEYYDLSVLNRYMKCRYIEGIFEVNEFYKEFLERAGIIEFTSNWQNGYATYYEDINGLEIIAFSVVIRQGEEIIAKCSLPLTPFENEDSSNRFEGFLGMDDSGEVYMECCVYILQGKDFVMNIGAGTKSVIEFAEFADMGIPGSMLTEKGWNHNRDVTIKGEDLLRFLNEKYPNICSKRLERIEKEKVYTLVADDFS